MQKENPVIKNYILSSKKRILTDEDTPLRCNNLYPSKPLLDYSGEHNIPITTNPNGFL